MDTFTRLLTINLSRNKSAFLWGPRKVGKSHQLKHLLLVYFEEEPKTLNGNIECLFWQDFLEQLWDGVVV